MKVIDSFISNKKIISAVLAIYLIINIFISVQYSVLNEEHNCIKNHCEVCINIKECIENLQLIGSAFITFATMKFVSLYFTKEIIRKTQYFINSITLISLKVRLDI